MALLQKHTFVHESSREISFVKLQTLFSFAFVSLATIHNTQLNNTLISDVKFFHPGKPLIL